MGRLVGLLVLGRRVGLRLDGLLVLGRRVGDLDVGFDVGWRVGDLELGRRVGLLDVGRRVGDLVDGLRVGLRVVGRVGDLVVGLDGRDGEREGVDDGLDMTGAPDGDDVGGVGELVTATPARTAEKHMQNSERMEPHPPTPEDTHVDVTDVGSPKFPRFQPSHEDLDSPEAPHTLSLAAKPLAFVPVQNSDDDGKPASASDRTKLGVEPNIPRHELATNTPDGPYTGATAYASFGTRSIMPASSPDSIARTPSWHVVTFHAVALMPPITAAAHTASAPDWEPKVPAYSPPALNTVTVAVGASVGGDAGSDVGDVVDVGGLVGLVEGDDVVGRSVGDAVGVDVVGELVSTWEPPPTVAKHAQNRGRADTHAPKPHATHFVVLDVASPVPPRIPPNHAPVAEPHTDEHRSSWP